MALTEVIGDLYVFLYNNTDGSVEYSWDDANDYCKAHYNTSLASFHSDEESTRLFNLRSSDVAIELDGWIGLNDKDNESTWKWVDGTPYDYHVTWGFGEPSNSNDDQHCVRMEENERADDYFCGWSKNVHAFWCNLNNNTNNTATTAKQVSQNIKAIKIWEQATNALFYTIIVFATILMGYAYHFHKQFSGKGADQPSFISLLKFFHQIGDLWTDIIFSIILLYQEHWLSGISIAIVAISYILTCLVGIKWIEKQRFPTNDRLRIYIEKFDTWLIVGAVFGGFYACISILCSKLFFLPQFHFQLKKKELIELQNKKFITVILFESIPQLTIQIIYILDKAANLNSTYALSPIVFMTMAFSILSIIIATMSQGSRIYQSFNKREKLYKYKSLIESKLTIKSKQLHKVHEFSNKTTRSAIDSLFKVCNQFKDRNLTDSSISGVSYQIDCYYIESHVKATQCMIAYFSIEIFTQTKNSDHDISIEVLNSLNDSQSANAELLQTALSLKLNLTDKSAIHFDLRLDTVQNRQTIVASRTNNTTETVRLKRGTVSAD